MSAVSCSIRRPTRYTALLAGAALTAAFWGSSAAVAQCHNTFNFGTGSVTPGGVKSLTPTTSALISITNTVNTAFFTNTTAFVSAPGGPKPDQDTGGVWARSVGGAVDSTTTTVDRPTSMPNHLLGGPSGEQVCHQSSNHSYTGVQVGADMGKLNIGSSGAAVHFGIMSGLLTASAKDTTPGVTAVAPGGGINLLNTYAPGDLTADFRVPFVGLYSVFTKGNFAADVQARWDWYESRSFSPGNNYAGLVDNAQGVSIAGGVYYRLLLQNWFVEPSVGGVWSRVQVDPLTTPLALGTFAKGTLRIEDIESLLGRGSVRVGVNLTQGMYTWQPFAVASVIHEFKGEVKSTLSISDPSLVPPPQLFDQAVFASTTSRVGTYGQFGLGMGVVAGNTGWLGYARVDVKVGDNVEGVGTNMGLRYQW